MLLQCEYVGFMLVWMIVVALGSVCVVDSAASCYGFLVVFGCLLVCGILCLVVVCLISGCVCGLVAFVVCVVLVGLVV